MPSIVAYMGWLGHNNIGDEACFLSIKSLVPGAKIVTCDLDPWDKPFLPDLLIVGGGTLLELSGDKRTTAIASLLDKGVPVIFWGTGVQPHNGSTSPLVLDILNKASFVGVRGPLSLAYLTNNGFSKGNVIGDPALLHRPIKAGNPSSKIIGVNIGDARNRMAGTEAYVIDQIVILVKRLYEKGFSVILFSMWPPDEVFLARVQKQTQAKLRAFDGNYINLMNFFSNCYCIIGMKLHACVLSAAANIPFISIAYREKCADFAESLGLGKWAISSGSPNLSSKIEQKVNLLEEYRNIIIERMQEKIAYYEKKHVEVHNLAFALLNK